jgi:hypothetical protein
VYDIPPFSVFIELAPEGILFGKTGFPFRQLGIPAAGYNNYMQNGE